MAEQINRTSLIKSLVQRYASDKTGGAFDAKKAGTNTAILGLQGDFGYTQLSRELTIEPGFTPDLRGSNFTEEALTVKGKYRASSRLPRYNP